MTNLQFTTASGSVYLVKDWTLTRQVEGSEILRRDGEPLKILSMTTIRVGAPATFELDLLENGVSTFRVTNTVTEIKEI